MPRESIQSTPSGVEEVDPVYRPQLRKQPIKYGVFEEVVDSIDYKTLVSGFIKRGEEFADKVIATIQSGDIAKPTDLHAPYPLEVLSLRNEFTEFAQEVMKANDELPYDGVRPGVDGHRIRGTTGNLMASIRIAMENKVRPHIVGGPNHNAILTAYWDAITLRDMGIGHSVQMNGLLAETSCDREKNLQFWAINMGSQISSLARDQLGLERYTITPEKVSTKVQELRDEISRVLKKATKDDLKVDAVWGVIKKGIERSVVDDVKYRWIKPEEAPKLLTQALALFETLK